MMCSGQGQYFCIGIYNAETNFQMHYYIEYLALPLIVCEHARAISVGQLVLYLMKCL